MQRIWLSVIARTLYDMLLSGFVTEYHEPFLDKGYSEEKHNSNAKTQYATYSPSLYTSWRSNSLNRNQASNYDSKIIYYI